MSISLYPSDTPHESDDGSIASYFGPSHQAMAYGVKSMHHDSKPFCTHVNAADSLAYHKLSPQKELRNKDLRQIEIVRKYTCAEANDLHQGFKSMLFLTPPTLNNDDDFSVRS